LAPVVRARGLVLALGLTLAAGPAGAQSVPAVDSRELLDRLLRDGARKLGVPGASAAVAVDGQVVWEGAYGVADLENEVPASPSHVFRLASISKTITAVAVLQLAERGKLRLDDDVRDHCRAWPPKMWPVRLRQILSHQGGIRDYRKGEWGSTRHYRGVVDALAAFKDDPLVFEPGTRFLYSSYGYSLLGCAVEGASGLPFVEYLRQNVFAPAGMTATRDDDATAFISGRAPGYQRGKDGVLRNSILADTSNKVPGGGLVGTARDVARFGAALIDGRLLPPQARRLMMEPQKTRSGVLTTSGLGVFLSHTDGVAEVWHVGGQPKVSTVLYLEPDRRRSVAILANLESVGNSLRDVARSLAKAASAPDLP
jgi:serine beta-lactamase-like protein LACTB